MRTHDSSSALTIDVEIADVKILFGALDLLFGVGVDGPGKPVFRAIGDRQGIVEILGFNHRQHRPENFFLRQPRLGIEVGDYSGLDEISFPTIRCTIATRYEPS